MGRVFTGTAQRLGETQRPVVCGEVRVDPEDVVGGDRDGIVVASEAELLALLPRAEEVQRAEAAVLERLERGEGLLGMLNFAEHCEALARGRTSKLRIRPEHGSRLSPAGRVGRKGGQGRDVISLQPVPGTRSCQAGRGGLTALASVPVATRAPGG